MGRAACQAWCAGSGRPPVRRRGCATPVPSERQPGRGFHTAGDPWVRLFLRNKASKAMEGRASLNPCTHQTSDLLEGFLGLVSRRS